MTFEVPEGEWHGNSRKDCYLILNLKKSDVKVEVKVAGQTIGEDDLKLINSFYHPGGGSPKLNSKVAERFFKKYETVFGMVVLQGVRSGKNVTKGSLSRLANGEI